MTMEGGFKILTYVMFVVMILFFWEVMIKYALHIVTLYLFYIQCVDTRSVSHTLCEVSLFERIIREQN